MSHQIAWNKWVYQMVCLSQLLLKISNIQSVDKRSLDFGILLSSTKNGAFRFVLFVLWEMIF